MTASMSVTGNLSLLRSQRYCEGRIETGHHIAMLYLVVEELLLYWVREIDVVVHKQVLLEQEHVVPGLPVMGG